MRKTLFTTIFAVCALCFNIVAQSSSNLVVFSENGERFVLSIDGKQINSSPEANVTAAGLKGEFVRLSIAFEDKAMGIANQDFMLEPGKEQKAMVKMNKKGKFVIWPYGEATPIADVPASAPKPAPVQPTPAPTTPTERVSTTTTVTAPVTTTTTTTTTTQGGEDINVNVQMGGQTMGISMQINDGMGMGETTTRMETTETVTHTQTVYEEPAYEEPAPVKEVVADCSPMAGGDLASVKKSIEDKAFAESKMTQAKQVLKANCMSSDQIAEMMQLFAYEDDKLEFAKTAYDKCSDPGNYWKLNDVFQFESSIDELNEFLESK